jgi:hypothetical protein
MICAGTNNPKRLWTVDADFNLSRQLFNPTGAAKPWASRRRHARALFIISWDGGMRTDWATTTDRIASPAIFTYR